MYRKKFRLMASVLGAYVLAFPVATSIKANEPKCYMVGLVTLKNKDWIGEYRPKTAKLLARHGGRILARGKPAAVLEGSARKANVVLIVEFPSIEKARAWYNDPEYKPLIRLRQTGSEADFVLIEELKP